ncbi:hypothetical protein IMG5_167700 [Ichthyophthirius multifiliis]|uniref:Transmembrane protein n=1 Tax=Ichthyophthirius multifiliis TaxID=5932 RepID=G0R0Z6_ICHMU|nr:hypothetical protein IMG5_167700 [Ichthyophthirius multifiliis]EGR28861.1 hypothetical protein IMG5_167700 [Ichthyophthirius multifiliis]|eukprot:XP_004030097.1 hypothetical protein IMG5_167700 [Ichthyophthirius multifiliis]
MHLDKNLESIVNREAILPKSNAQFLDDQSQDPSQSQDHKIKNDLLPQKQINKIVDHPVMLGEQENQQLKNGFSEKSNSNLIEVKQGNRKKVIILSSVGILIAIGLIFGGLAIGGVFSSQSIVEKMNYNKQVKLPESYVKFEQQINIGQEKNILQLIQVPLSQKIYEYKLENEQITTTGDGKVTSKKSVITHTFNYLCYQISNIEFDMYLYFTSTVISENDQVQSTLTGYPAILEKEKANNIRNIEDNVQKSQQTQDDTSKQVNEYAPLTAQEIKLLQEKGISEEQFNFSKYPIVRFTLSKEGEIKKIYEPINLRNDLQQIYLNIIEQLSPLLRKDLYNIFETDKETGKKRILKNASESYKYRNLNNVEVTPQHEAEISDDGKGVLKSTEPEVSENGNQQGEYSQECTIENGSLLRSSVSSKFTIKGNQEDSTSMFKQIDNISAVIIQYIDWEHKVDETFVQNLIQIQQKMSYFIMTKQQVLDKRAKSYLKPKENPNSVISDDSKGRVLVGIDENRNLVFEEQPKNNDNFQEPKPMGEVIQQSIFRKNFESIDFGADIKSECIESGFYSSEDVCTVGLYGYFNGSMTKIIERQTKINVSRLLKLNWYIQHVLVEKMGSVEKYVNSKLDGIVQKVNAILDQLELLLDINKNPVLKVINDAIQNDQFEIMDSINGFEQTINKTLQDFSKKKFLLF